MQWNDLNWLAVVVIVFMILLATVAIVNPEDRSPKEVQIMKACNWDCEGEPTIKNKCLLDCIEINNKCSEEVSNE